MDYTIFVPGKAAGPVFCDWLDVTCSPDNSFVDSVLRFLDRLSCQFSYRDDKTALVSVGSGKVRVDTNPKFHRVSSSGHVLSHLRATGAYSDFLSLLSEVPHSVTRLDAACDYDLDTPDILDALDQAFPDDRINFSRKALKVTRLLSRRVDGRLTGTWYGGHKAKAKCSVRIYDKAHEVAQKQGLYALYGLTRVEFTARKAYGASLSDAYNPESLYYSMGSPTLMAIPPGVAEWSSAAEFTAWQSPDLDEPLPFELFRRRLETSPDIDRLAEIAAEMGAAGVKTMERIFSEKVRSKVALREVTDE